MFFFLVSCSAGSQTTERSGDSGTALAEQAVIEGNKGRAQDSEPWSEAQLMAPAELAALLEGASAGGEDVSRIICIGPGALIPGSEDVGQTTHEANLEKLERLLSDEDRDRPVVLYCGCCPFERCPNIRPAFSLLNEMDFTGHRLLNLATNLKTDWIDKGYPVVE